MDVISLLACTRATVLSLSPDCFLSSYKYKDTPSPCLTLHALSLPHFGLHSSCPCSIFQIPQKCFTFPLCPHPALLRTNLALGRVLSRLSRGNYSNCAWGEAVLTRAWPHICHTKLPNSRPSQSLKKKITSNWYGCCSTFSGTLWCNLTNPNLLSPEFWCCSFVNESLTLPARHQKGKKALFQFSHGVVINYQRKSFYS